MSKRTIFNPEWLKKTEYAKWIEEDDSCKNQFKCKLCKHSYTLGNMGKKALDTHARGDKHKQRETFATKMKSDCVPISSFLTSDPVHTNSSSSIPSSSDSDPLSSSICGGTKSQDAASGMPSSSNLGASAFSNQDNQSQLPSTLGIDRHMTEDSVLTAEVIWALKTVMSHQSCASSAGSDKLFQRMFPDSTVAKKFSCGSTKCHYLLKFGLAPYFEQNLLNQLAQPGTVFVVSFDESLNKHIQEEQMDMYVRFWDREKNRVVTQYFTSEFLGHTRADDILTHFLSALSKFNLASILQISMDGPATNWKFYEELVKKREEQDAGMPCLLNIGSCGLHVVHGAFKTGAQSTGWNVDTLLRALYYLFADSPARREEYTSASGSKQFPLKFSSTRWLEDIQVAERALLIWPNVNKYVTVTTSGPKSKVPKIQSFTTIREGVHDPLTPAKLQFFITVAKVLNPFLEKFQTNNPMMPFMRYEMENILKNLMTRFVKSTVLDEETSVSVLLKIDFFKEENLTNVKEIGVGFAVKTVVKNLQKSETIKISELQLLEFYHGCRIFLQSVVSKLVERCPLKYLMVRYLTALNPKDIAKDQEAAQDNFDKLIGKLLSSKWLDTSLCDDASNQYRRLLTNVKRYHLDYFEDYSSTDSSLDSFWCQMVGGKEEYAVLWSVIQKMLILSHGQAAIERGFSVNKSVSTVNMGKDTLIAYRKVYDGVSLLECSAHDVPINKEMLKSCRNARSRYKLYQEDQKRAEAAEATVKKRKMLLVELEECKKKKRMLESTEKQLMDDADNLYAEAEKKKKMVILSKANALRAKGKEKQSEISQVEKEIEHLEKNLKDC